MAGDRKFYMQKGSTYIEKQVNYIRGNQIIGRETDSEESHTEEAPTGTSTIEGKMKAVASAIEAMVNEGELQKKQDFGAIKKVVDDMAIFEKFSNKVLLELLKTIDIPSSLMPSESSLKVYNFGKAVHPNWKIADADPIETQRIIDLGATFKDIYDTFI